MRAARTARPKNRRREGVATVEFALILPILLTLVLGVLEIGRYVEVRQIVTSAVREGARQASTGTMTNAQIVSVVTGCIKNAGLPTTSVSVTVSNLTNPALDVSDATTLDKLQVSASLTFKDVRWCSAVKWTNNTTKVSASSVWHSSIPQSYPTNVSAPLGF